MYTIKHSLIAAHSGEPVKIVFTVTNRSGNAVTVAGAAATYKIARHPGEPALLTKTDGNGITLASNTATVEFNASELLNGSAALLGDFFGQLRISMNGDSLVAAEGQIYVAPVVL